MPQPYKYDISNTIRSREFDLSSAFPTNLDFSSSESSLSAFQQLLEQANQKELYGRETGNVWDAIGSTAWGYTDMATFHLGRYLTDDSSKSLAETMGKHMSFDPTTTVGYFGEQLGSAAGF